MDTGSAIKACRPGLCGRGKETLGLRAAALTTAAAPIRLGLEAQRLFGHWSDERLVVNRDDDDAGVGDGVTPAILLGVVPDERAARDQHVAIDDRAADPRVSSDAH